MAADWKTRVSKEIDIPQIDFAEFKSGDPKVREACAQKIVSAFKTIGFVYLANALPIETKDKAFALAKGLFAKSTEEKKKIAWESFTGKRGFVVNGREQIFNPDDIPKLRDNGKFDVTAEMKPHRAVKESWEIGRVPSFNQYPEDWPEYKEFWEKFYYTMNSLYLEILSALAIGLGLPKDFFEAKCNDGDNTLKAMHYPPVPKDLTDVRMMAHTDLEVITLLLQDDAGGLEVKNKQGDWVKAVPVPGCVTLNAGDLLQRWSNGSIMSTMHRVCPPPTPTESDMYPSRYSIAYFAGANPETYVDALPGTYESEKDKKWAGVVTRDYVNGGFKDLYGGVPEPAPEAAVAG